MHFSRVMLQAEQVKRQETSGHKILFHWDNRFLLLLFYCYGNNEQLVKG